MQLLLGDWIIILLYFGASLGLGLFLSRGKGKSLTDYFLFSRQGHYLLVGTGMVATTFGADTPLTVSGLVGSFGVSGNWIWWSAAIGGMFTVWFFARLWRRAGVLTDLEFIELRYSGPLAAVLRGTKAVYFGLLLNLVVMAWVNLAMLKIIEVTFPESKALWIVVFSGGLTYAEAIVSLCALATLLYVAVSGLWGVMIADAFQFAVALAGCTLLAWFAMQHPAIAAKGGLAAALPPELLDFFPDWSSHPQFPAPGFEDWQIAKISLSAFLAYVLVQWWASWYPGAEPGGGGYIAQRIMSAKNERHGTLATLWFVVAHYCVRSWPWVIAGLCVIVIYPELQAANPGLREEGYVRLLTDVLPSPFRGMLLAAFLGAYMSTISTHLNWGASYLVNDFYKRFVKKDKKEEHYIFVSKISTIFLSVFSLFVAFTILGSIREAWIFLLSTTAGMGFVLILRWYWWRINAAAELASMIAPVFVVAALAWFKKSAFLQNRLLSLGWEFPQPPVDLFLIAPISIILILLVQYLSKPEPEETLRSFYKKVRPEGPGWLAWQKDVEGIAKDGGLFWSLGGWISGIVLVFSGLYLPGALLFGRHLAFAVALLLFLGSALCVHVCMGRLFGARTGRA